MATPWQTITNLGDIAVTGPVAAAIALWLLANDATRKAGWWSLLFGFGMAAVVISKVAFIGWGIGIRALDFTGFSGHSMRATAVMPVLFFLLLQQASPAVRRCGVAVGLLAGVLVGVSRVVLDAHSTSEVVAGCILGGTVGLGFIAGHGGVLKAALHPALIALGLAATVVGAPHVQPSPTQQWITSLALYVSGHERPFVRHGWQFAGGKALAPGRRRAELAPD